MKLQHYIPGCGCHAAGAGLRLQRDAVSLAHGEAQKKTAAKAEGLGGGEVNKHALPKNNAIRPGFVARLLSPEVGIFPASGFGAWAVVIGEPSGRWAAHHSLHETREEAEACADRLSRTHGLRRVSA